MMTRGDQVLTLRRDNYTAGDYWILADGDTVTVCAQKVGESPIGSVTIPREEFNRLVRWYTRPQKTVKP
jgi:hypothetical protein